MIRVVAGEPEIVTYFDQLSAAAKAAGVELLDACLDAGVADSTFYRWRKGSHEPTRETADRVMQSIVHLARNDDARSD